MDFEQRPPEWENVGAEPTTEIKKKGFTAGYKPPAAYFNWFWNRVGKCIAEIQGNLETLSKMDVGLGNVDNTKDAEKPISNAVQTALAGKASNTHAHPVSTTTQDGFMSGADKAKLDKIEPNAGVNIATTTKAGIVKATADFAVAADGTPTLKISDTKVNVTDTNNHFTATKLDGVLEEIYTKATTIEGRLDNKIGSLSSLQTTNKNNVVAAVNECFTKVNEVGVNALTQRTYTTTIGTTWVGAAAPFTQEITVAGLKGTDAPIVDTILSTDTTTALLQEKAWGYVSRITTLENKIKVYCNKNKPVTAIQIQLKVVG